MPENFLGMLMAEVETPTFGKDKKREELRILFRLSLRKLLATRISKIVSLAAAVSGDGGGPAVDMCLMTKDEQYLYASLLTDLDLYRQKYTPTEPLVLKATPIETEGFANV